MARGKLKTVGVAPAVGPRGRGTGINGRPGERLAKRDKIRQKLFFPFLFSTPVPRFVFLWAKETGAEDGRRPPPPRRPPGRAGDAGVRLSRSGISVCKSPFEKYVAIKPIVFNVLTCRVVYLFRHKKVDQRKSYFSDILIIGEVFRSLRKQGRVPGALLIKSFRKRRNEKCVT